MDSTFTIVLGLVVFLIAGTIKGTVGVGLPVAAVGLLAQFTDPRLAIALAIAPIFVANIWQMYRAGEVWAAARRYTPFVAALIAVMLATALVVPAIPTDVLVIFLGLAIIIFAVTSLAVALPAIPEHLDRPAQIVAGSIAGIFGGLTAIWSPPMVIYFLARRIDKDEFMRASGVLLFIGGIPLLAGYLHNGLLNWQTAPLSLLMIVPTLIGFAIGEQMRTRLNTDRFRNAVLVVFLLMGLNLLREALF